jgi:hypothetical protein
MTTQMRRLAAMMLTALLSAVLGLAPVAASAQANGGPGVKAYVNSSTSAGISAAGGALATDVVLVEQYQLRETHMRLTAIQDGVTQQLVIAILGDSYVQGNYWSQAFAKRMHALYGMAGVGYVGFGFFGSDVATPFATGGAQPGFGGITSVDGNVRPDLVPTPTFDGVWGSAGATAGYNSAGSGLPSLSYAQSTTAGDRVRFSFPAGHTAARVYYNANASGSFRYSWDGGSTWVATITYSSSSGSLSAALSAVPSGAATLILEVVSGTVRLGGVDMQSSAAGVRIHKLGVSGSATNTWSAAAAGGQWRTRMLDLAPNLYIAGWQTNDQGAAFPPTTTYTTNMTAIIAGIRAASPVADILLTSPPENQRTSNAYPMTQYTAAARSLAHSLKTAHLDHQVNFGDVAADYASSNANRPWYSSDLIHPVKATGGNALANAVLRAVSPPQ